MIGYNWWQRFNRGRGPPALLCQQALIEFLVTISDVGDGILRLRPLARANSKLLPQFRLSYERLHRVGELRFISRRK